MPVWEKAHDNVCSSQVLLEQVGEKTSRLLLLLGSPPMGTGCHWPCSPFISPQFWEATACCCVPVPVPDTIFHTILMFCIVHTWSSVYPKKSFLAWFKLLFPSLEPIFNCTWIGSCPSASELPPPWGLPETSSRSTVRPSYLGKYLASKANLGYHLGSFFLYRILILYLLL